MRKSNRQRKSPRTRKSANRSSSRRSPTSRRTPQTVATRAVDFTADVVQEVANALATITGGVFDGASAIVNTAGSVVDQFGDMFNVYATQVFRGAGDGAKYVANQMGLVLRNIPTVGGGVAYVVESVGGAVYHIVVAVGTLGGSSVKRAGRVVRRASDLVVYTLTVGNQQVGDARREVNGLVGKFAKNISGR
jgi:hypothetical protein